MNCCGTIYTTYVLSSHAGLITVGNDISQLFVSVALSYYAGRSHRPRWIAFGIYTVSFITCILGSSMLMRCAPRIIRVPYFRVDKKQNQLSAHAPRNEPVDVITHRLVGS